MTICSLFRRCPIPRPGRWSLLPIAILLTLLPGRLLAQSPTPGPEASTPAETATAVPNPAASPTEPPPAPTPVASPADAALPSPADAAPPVESSPTPPTISGPTATPAIADLPAAAPAPAAALSPFPAATPAPTVTSAPKAAPSPVPVLSGVPLDAPPTEVGKIYGPVVKRNARVRRHVVLDGTAAMDGDLYSKDGLIIRALFQKGRCALLEYVRAGGGLTPADVKSALAINAGSFSWELGKDSTDTSKFYRRSDGRAIANWSTEYDGSLLIATEDADTGFAKYLMR